MGERRRRTADLREDKESSQYRGLATPYSSALFSIAPKWRKQPRFAEVEINLAFTHDAIFNGLIPWRVYLSYQDPKSESGKL